MNKRLVREFRIGDKVEINFGNDQWSRAIVVELAHPGLWVQDKLGRRWFVTNTRRIRRWQDAA